MAEDSFTEAKDNASFKYVSYFLSFMNKETWQTTAILILVIGLLALNYAQGNEKLIERDTGRDRLIVSADATKSVIPDELEMTFRIETNGTSARQVQDTNARISSLLITELQNAGIKRENIETTTYTLEKYYEWEPTPEYYSGKQVFKGFKNIHTIKIKTKNPAQAGILAEIAGRLGNEINIEGIEFTLSKESQAKIKQELLAQAAKNAREKAQTISQSIGIKLGKITSATETQYYMPAMNRYAMTAESVMPDIPPATLTIQAQLQLEYSIE
jgi:uncharacterized protein YggE